MKKRGQAAMEFLTTYGWAILILIIVTSALAALGVFSGPQTPNKCESGAPIACGDVSLRGANNEFVLVISSSGTSPGSGIISLITLESPSQYEFWTCDSFTNANGNNQIGIEEFVELTCTSWKDANGVAAAPEFSDSDSFSGTASIDYSLAGVTGITHTTDTYFSGNVEGDSPAFYDLTVSKLPLANSGSITSNPTGINCGGSCLTSPPASFAANTLITLTADFPGTGTGCIAWSGTPDPGSSTCLDCSSAVLSCTCTFTMNQDRLVTADFGATSCV